MLMMQLLQRKDTTQAADSVIAETANSASETGTPPIPEEANSGEVGAIPQMVPEMKNAELNEFRIWILFQKVTGGRAILNQFCTKSCSVTYFPSVF